MKLGVVGCGGRGSWIANLFRKHGGYEMHAVADYFPEVAQKCGQALGVDPARCFSTLSGYRRVIESGVEAVALETPPCFFPEHVAAAVEAGLHVYMAKPVAVDVPGCLQVQAAAKRAGEKGRCFLVDYQLPTDPFNIECVNRFRQQALGTLGMVRTHYYGGGFDDPPLADTIEGRLQKLIWCNDMAIGGGHHVNAAIHPIQGAMWALNQSPVAASGACRTARLNPHGDSPDMFAVTYEFADGLVWSHTGRHSDGMTPPETPLAYCEFFGDAFMRLGYGGRALIRGGEQQYAGGEVEKLYLGGAERNIASFHRDIAEGNTANSTVPLAIESCLVSILGHEAAARKTRLTLADVLRENKRWEVNLKGLKT